MRKITTLKGEKELHRYTRVCPHEHLLLDMTHEAVMPKTLEEQTLFYSQITMDNLGKLRRNPYVMRENLILDSIEDAVNELSFLKKHNIDLFIDLTSIGLGRNIKKLNWISQHSDLDIVVGTGFFVHDSLNETERLLSTDEMVEIMLQDIECGIDDTNLRAGVIGEIGVSEKIYPVEKRSLLAAAKVHSKTGLPIYVHTYPWSRAGFEAAQLLIDNNVAPKSICICHIDVTFDYEYLLMLLKLGVYIEFDNLGKEFYFESQDGAFAGGPFATDVERMQMVKKLIKDGYTKQILLASDVCLKASLHKYGGWGYDHPFENFVPMMRCGEIDPSDITQIIDKNPIDFLTQE